MDGTQLPITISLMVGGIGLIGLVAAGVAWKDVGDQRAKLRQGRNALADLPDSSDESIDYRQWLKERHLDDSHFGDHLRSASDARCSGRGISLSELHQVSARREARSWSARLSRGVTGLLLVCGIAGTLWCIKPVLSAFKVGASSGGVVSGPGSVDIATTMINDLGEAFWPSLVALILTVVIAFARGFYTHARGILAGELDQLDLEDLFRRFPPPSLGRELDGVRAQLGELAAQMSASQGNFDNFVTRLSKAANGLGINGPPLAQAAQQFTTAATGLAPKIDDLIAALSGHLGPGAPLVVGLGELQAVGGQVAAATAQIQMAGSVLSKHILLSHQVLREAAEQLPAQIEAGCQSGSAIIADRAAAAIAGARVEAVQALEAAVVPVRQAADGINQANHELRADVARTVDAGVADMEQAFTQHLQGVVATIGQAQASVADAVNQVGVAVDRLTALSEKADLMLKDSARGQEALASTTSRIDDTDKLIAASSETLGGVANSVTDVERQLTAATERLGQVMRESSGIGERFGELAGRIDQLTTRNADLVQQLETLRTGHESGIRTLAQLLASANQLETTWPLLLADTRGLIDAGGGLNTDLGRLHTEVVQAADRLERAATAASGQQGELLAQLRAIGERLQQFAEAKAARRGWFGRSA